MVRTEHMTSHDMRAFGLDAPVSLTRRAIGDEIERLIAMLDAADPDPDFEDNGDERDASYPERHGVGGHLAMQHPNEDDEDGHDREADTSDDEPRDGGDFDGSGCADDPQGEFGKALDVLKALKPAAGGGDITVDEWIARYEALPPDAQRIVRAGLFLLEAPGSEAGQ